MGMVLERGERFRAGRRIENERVRERLCELV